MDRIIEATRDPNPMPAGTPPTADRPRLGFTLARNGAFTVPSMARIKSTHSLATRWHELHPGIPLIPLHRQERGPKKDRTSPGQPNWVPVDGWWDGPPPGLELARLLKADPSLGVGLRLGRRGPGMPWLVDILVRKVGEAKPALRRMFDRHDRDRGATWCDEEGAHWVFVGDDRLARFGPLVVGTIKGAGGHPHYAGLEIRLGSDDPATSLLVLPPTPLGDGRRREAGSRDEFTTLTAQVYADLERFALATEVGADDPRTTSAEGADEPRGPAAPRPKRRSQVAAPRGPGDLIPGGSTSIGPPNPELPATASHPGLPALAMSINRWHRRCMISVSDALLYARQAGDELLRVKAGLAHGEFQAWVLKNCEFKYRTAANYMEVSRRWPEVQEWRTSNVQHAAPLSWSGFLKWSAAAKKESTEFRAPTRPGLIDQITPADLDRSPTDPALPGRADPLDGPAAPRAVRGRGAMVPAMAVTCLSAADPDRSEPTLRVDPLEHDGREAPPPGPTTGDAPAGVAITEKSRRREEDLLFLLGDCPIRVRLAKVGDTRAFEADATLWRLLRGIEGEVLARQILADKEHGLYAAVLVAFLLAAPPEKWDLCPSCEGTGRALPEGGPCSNCSGGGYIIPS
jgi:hypothetical protein